MKKEVILNLTWLINRLAENYVYNLNDINKNDYDLFYDALKNNIDLNKLTVREAKLLRFKRWDEEEQPNLWLFPLWLVPIIPEGLEVTFIDGKKAKYEKNKMNNDIRFGCVAYGIEIGKE